MAKVLTRRPGQAARRGEIVPTRSRLETLPASLLERFEEMMGRFEPWWPALRWPSEAILAPAIDMYEEGDALVLEAEVPGLEKGDVEVDVTGDVLTIKGTKEKEEKVERKDYFRFERSAGAFTRSVRLPFEVQVDKMTAKLENGVLEVRAPKTEAAKAGTRKIQVA